MRTPISVALYSLYCIAPPLLLSLPLSLTRCWGAGSSSLADVEKRKGEAKHPSREALGSNPLPASLKGGMRLATRLSRARGRKRRRDSLSIHHLLYMRTPILVALDPPYCVPLFLLEQGGVYLATRLSGARGGKRRRDGARRGAPLSRRIYRSIYANPNLSSTVFSFVVFTFLPDAPLLALCSCVVSGLFCCRVRVRMTCCSFDFSPSSLIQAACASLRDSAARAVGSVDTTGRAAAQADSDAADCERDLIQWEAARAARERTALATLEETRLRTAALARSATAAAAAAVTARESRGGIGVDGGVAMVEHLRAAFDAARENVTSRRVGQEGGWMEAREAEQASSAAVESAAAAHSRAISAADAATQSVKALRREREGRAWGVEREAAAAKLAAAMAAGGGESGGEVGGGDGGGAGLREPNSGGFGDGGDGDGGGGAIGGDAALTATFTAAVRAPTAALATPALATRAFATPAISSTHAAVGGCGVGAVEALQGVALERRASAMAAGQQLATHRQSCAGWRLQDQG